MKKDGKNYRFSDQLEALDHHSCNQQQQQNYYSSSSVLSLDPHKLQIPVLPTNIPSSITPNNININPSKNITHHQSTSLLQNINTTTTTATTTSSSSFSSGEEQSEGTRKKKKKKKRKLEAFFDNLMKEVIEKQENLQKRFLEEMEKREHERIVREEAWKMQEMARMNRQHEILAQERAMAAARDAAVIAFLNKISAEQNNPIPSPQIMMRENNSPSAPLMEKNSSSIIEINPRLMDNGSSDHETRSTTNLMINPINYMAASSSSSIISSSRWPKAEVQALIKLRTGLDRKYAESSPKGPLWEEVSAAMKKLGYDRSAKKCKEKWENINKYFKKVKESNKKRSEDCKTCPYFDLLDALYKEKMMISSSSTVNAVSTTYGSDHQDHLVMQIMTHPAAELQAQQQRQQPVRRPVLEEADLKRESNNNNNGRNHDHQEEEEEEGDDDDDGDGDGDEDEAPGYEIAVNNPSSMTIVE